MRIGKHAGLGILALVTLVYGIVYFVVQANLTAVSAALAEQPVKVILDAGHGGEDGGAVSASGCKESDINLQIALRLEQLLALLGAEPHMIRTQDVSVYTGSCDTLTEKKVSDLKNRVKTVNAVTPAILVSIHQNHFSSQAYSGAQVFYGKTTGSSELADCMQQSLRQGLDPNNKRDIKRAEHVYLMEHAACPAILVECGFLSHPQEALLLQQDIYQTKLVCAIAQGVVQYLEKGESSGEV